MESVLNKKSCLLKQLWTPPNQVLERNLSKTQRREYHDQANANAGASHTQ